MWTNHSSLSLCFSWLQQIGISTDRCALWHSDIYFSCDGCLSSLNLHSILSKRRLYHASTWCKSWISHDTFSVGALKTRNAGADSTSNSCYYTLRITYHNEKTDASLIKETKTFFWMQPDIFSTHIRGSIFSTNFAEICLRKANSDLCYQIMMDQRHVCPVRVNRSRVPWKPVLLTYTLHFYEFSFPKWFQWWLSKDTSEPRWILFK